ncbi:DUF547 domain-containing protein [Myxococcota bacterium]|nr:DUF547 domain-containing protein [Myxococcota bacterium]
MHLKSLWLIGLASLLAVGLFLLRPGGVEGPRPAPVPPEGKGFSHAQLTEALKGVVDEAGDVDYGALRAHPEALDRYLGQLRAASPKSAPHRFKTEAARLAYYINAYNAFLLAELRQRCPLARVADLYPFDGFFYRVSFLMGEEETTLSALADEQISALAHLHPAIRLALSKGSVSAPMMLREALEEATLTAQLDALARRALAHPRWVKREGDTLALNPLFEWYPRELGDHFIKAIRPELLEGVSTRATLPLDDHLNGHCQAR